MTGRRTHKITNAIRTLCHGDIKPCKKYRERKGDLIIEHRCKVAKEQRQKHAEFGIVVIE